MKQLHLLRHAKSAWDQPAQPDRERGLNKRGRRDAPRMGHAIAQRLAPMPVHASPARRAQLTLEGLVQGWPALGEHVHRTEESLYTFDVDVLMQWIARRPPVSSALFIVSHNPALTDLINVLAPDARLDNLPTGGYAELVLDIDRWRDLMHGCATLRYTLFPREFADG